MPKKQPSKRKETQHDKFVKLARASGASDSESAFVGKLKKIAPTRPNKKSDTSR